MDGNPKIGGFGTPKMDGENNGKPYFLMDDFGGTPIFWKHPYVFICFQENKVNRYFPLPETNSSSHQKEDDFPFGKTAYFHGRTVSFRAG